MSVNVMKEKLEKLKEELQASQVSYVNCVKYRREPHGFFDRGYPASAKLEGIRKMLEEVDRLLDILDPKCEQKELTAKPFCPGKAVSDDRAGNLVNDVTRLYDQLMQLRKQIEPSFNRVWFTISKLLLEANVPQNDFIFRLLGSTKQLDILLNIMIGWRNGSPSKDIWNDCIGIIKVNCPVAYQEVVLASPIDGPS